MTTVTLPKKEYQRLIDKALRYEYLRQILEEDIFGPPPTKNIKGIIREFRKTKLYNQKFLKSLEKGLKRSSLFRNLKIKFPLPLKYNQSFPKREI